MREDFEIEITEEELKQLQVKFVLLGDQLKEELAELEEDFEFVSLEEAEEEFFEEF